MQRPVSRSKSARWFLYMLKCRDGSLYTGVTTDVEKRFKLHVAGKAARYTRGRTPLRIVYQETCKTRSSAQVLEAFVKTLPRARKLTLIKLFKGIRN